MAMVMAALLALERQWRIGGGRRRGQRVHLGESGRMIETWRRCSSRGPSLVADEA